MIRPPPRSTRTAYTLSLHDALPISHHPLEIGMACDHLGVSHHDLLQLPAGFPRVLRIEQGNFVQQHDRQRVVDRSEEHTSELQSLMRISYAVFCLKKKNNKLHI